MNDMYNSKIIKNYRMAKEELDINQGKRGK